MGKIKAYDVISSFSDNDILLIETSDGTKTVKVSTLVEDRSKIMRSYYRDGSHWSSMDQLVDKNTVYYGYFIDLDGNTTHARTYVAQYGADAYPYQQHCQYTFCANGHVEYRVSSGYNSSTGKWSWNDPKRLGQTFNIENGAVSYDKLDEALKTKIDAAQPMRYEVVTTLPATGAGNVIYLKKNGSNYEQWLYNNNEWVMIGTTAVDLSGKVDKTQTIAGISLRGNIAASALRSAIAAVPTSRQIAGLSLIADISAENLREAISAVSEEITIAGLPLSSDISASSLLAAIDAVPSDRTVAGLPLSSDISIAQLKALLVESSYQIEDPPSPKPNASINIYAKDLVGKPKTIAVGSFIYCVQSRVLYVCTNVRTHQHSSSMGDILSITPLLFEKLPSIFVNDTITVGSNYSQELVLSLDDYPVSFQAARVNDLLYLSLDKRLYIYKEYRDNRYYVFSPIYQDVSSAASQTIVVDLTPVYDGGVLTGLLADRSFSELMSLLKSGKSLIGKIIYGSSSVGSFDYTVFNQFRFDDEHDSAHIDCLYISDISDEGEIYRTSFEASKGNDDDGHAYFEVDVDDVISFVTHDEFTTRLARKADQENGNVRVSSPEYYSGSDHTMEGTYQRVGEYCTVTATAKVVAGRQYTYYRLPFVPLSNIMAFIMVGTVEYAIKTDTTNGYNCVNIYRTDGNFQAQGDDSVPFTITYRCSDDYSIHQGYTQAEVDQMIANHDAELEATLSTI